MRLFVPGRVCLVGEHSDWAGGHRRSNPVLEIGATIVCGTNQGIYASVTPHPDSLLLSSVTANVPASAPYRIPLTPDDLLQEARQGGFWSYIAGTTYQALLRYPIGGLVIENDATDLPVKKGLSSSAAICVLTARALNQIYQLGLTTREEMELAYLGEITTPSQCGRMDQACAFGRTPVLMTYNGDHLTVREIHAACDLHLVVADLNSQKDTLKILRCLNACYPHAQDDLHRGVQELLGPLNHRLVMDAVEAIETGDAARLGGLFNQAQANFDRLAVPACPEELAAPALHRALTLPELQPLILGAKGVGSQGDGSVQFLTEGADQQQRVKEILQQQMGLNALELTIHKNGVVQPLKV